MILNVRMTPADFDQMTTGGTPWRGSDLAASQAAERTIENMAPDRNPTDPFSPSWSWVYWIALDWWHVMVCRAFLDDLGYPYEIGMMDDRNLTDPESQGYALMTDYRPEEHGETPGPLTARARA